MSRAKPRLSRWVTALAFVLVFVLDTIVAAQSVSPDDPHAQARVVYESAERAATEMHFAAALTAYDQAIALDPSAPFVRIARARAADLRTHAEGDFGPLVRLESVRRNVSSTREDIEKLARDAERFPPGRVRSEAQLLVAEAFWHRFDLPDRAASALDAVLVDASADRLTRALALTELVTLERSRDRLDAAAEVLARYPDLAPSKLAEVQRLMRRVWLGRLALGIVGFVSMIGIIAIVRAIFWQRRDAEEVLREAVKTSTVAFALYIGGAAALLVRAHGEGDVRPFLSLGFGVLVIDAAARAWRVGFVDERTLARLGRAITCAIAVLAVAFLALRHSDAVYLETLGL